ncbi:MAG TPA: translation elongation factor Ts, partial [Chloroflexota bacterium]|nr:translation elongation factor Ts [Chloroflexota bacterium]
AALIKQLRDRTGAGVMECRKALDETTGDLDKAEAVLHRRGLDRADKLAGREAEQGLIDSYIHNTGTNVVGVLVEVNCATDFVARNEAFKTLAHELALHIAASNPQAVDEESLDKAWVEEEQTKLRNDPELAGRPKDIQDKILEGRMQKRLQEVVLMKQPWVKDPSKTIEQLVKETSGKLQEPVKVRRFARFELGK